ncbi:MAG TPA: hypothetical protein VLO00_01710, partial [Cryobacterium sp.]|nr:hypothetical protein [Cryobacterium sp.]
PAYLTAVATAALTGGSQAEQHIDIDGVRVIREPTAVVVGSGKDDGPDLSLALSGTVTTRHDRGATVVETSTLRLVVVRVLTEQDPPSQDFPSQDSSRSAVLDDHAFTAVLTGTWTNQPSPRTLVQVQAR